MAREARMHVNIERATHAVRFAVVRGEMRMMADSDALLPPSKPSPPPSPNSPSPASGTTNPPAPDPREDNGDAADDDLSDSQAVTAAYNALKDWMKEFKGVARVLLRKRPDLLRDLGL